MQYKENDILVDKYGDERKVLGICGQVCFLSRTDDFDWINGTYTKKELDEVGYHLKSNAPTITILRVHLNTCEGTLRKESYNALEEELGD